jgi:hypothetical protein
LGTLISGVSKSCVISGKYILGGIMDAHTLSIPSTAKKTFLNTTPI